MFLEHTARYAEQQYIPRAGATIHAAGIGGFYIPVREKLERYKDPFSFHVVLQYLDGFRVEVQHALRNTELDLV